MNYTPRLIISPDFLYFLVCCPAGILPGSCFLLVLIDDPGLPGSLLDINITDKERDFIILV